MTTFKPFLHFISLLAVAVVSSCAPRRALSQGEIGEYVRFSTENVLYLVVKTGYVGTTSNVSITVGDNEGHTLTIPNLVDWDINPLTPPGYIYFQAGRLDILAGPVNLDAFTSKACSINITITGTGGSPGWYPDQIVMTSTASVIGMFTFYIYELFAPYNNYTVARTVCPRTDKGIMTGCTKASLAIST